MFGRCYLFCEIRKQDGWVYVKSNWRRTGFIDLYDIILQVIHTGNCGLTDKKVHQYAGDRYKQDVYKRQEKSWRVTVKYPKRLSADTAKGSVHLTLTVNI